MRIDFYGLFSSEMGIGEAARRLLQDLIENDIEVNVIDLQVGHSRKQAAFPKTVHQTNQTIAILALNPDAIPLAFFAFGKKLRGYSHTIAFWSWELEVVPHFWGTATTLFDEIWTVSDYSKKAIETISSVPVRTIRLPLSQLSKNAQYVKTSDTVTFLTSFDFASDINRKNPAASIVAYKEAISPNTGARLLVKTINSSRHSEEAFELRKLAANRDDIVFIDEYFDENKNQNLIMNSDCFLSLHRAEGLGLNILDAATYGVPTISTSYSAPIEYLTGPSNMLVMHKKTTVKFYAGQRVDAEWADPDIDHASDLISKLFQSPFAQGIRKAMSEGFIANYSTLRNSDHIERLKSLDRLSHRNSNLTSSITKLRSLLGLSINLFLTYFRRRVHRYFIKSRH